MAPQRLHYQPTHFAWPAARLHQAWMWASRRYRSYVLLAAGLTGLLLLSIPTLISHSPAGKMLLSQRAAGYGFKLDANTFQIGWFTPLQISGIEIHCQSAENSLRIGQLESDLTFLALVLSAEPPIGWLRMRDVEVRCRASAMGVTTEDQLLAFMANLPTERITPDAKIEILNIHLAITQEDTNRTWTISQFDTDIHRDNDCLSATFSGQFTEPAGKPGAAQGKFSANLSTVAQAPSSWQLDVHGQAFPLSIASLLGPGYVATSMAGEASGSVCIAGPGNGGMTASLEDIEIDHFIIDDSTEQITTWKNRHATLQGQLELSRDGILSANLKSSTDFATVAINGSFPGTLLDPQGPPPLAWLAAMEGKATAQIDLAKLAKARQGPPWWDDSLRLVSGTADASVTGDPANGCQFSVTSQPIQATLNGQLFDVEPIHLSASLDSDAGEIRAQRFALQSSLANLVGHGNLLSGNAKLTVSSNRLAHVLWPSTASSTMEGPLECQLDWSTSSEATWQFTAAANASQLRMVGGHKSAGQPTDLQALLVASGRWQAATLEELSSGSLTVHGKNVDLRCDLLGPAQQPGLDSLLPFTAHGSGDISGLADVLGGWLPPKFHGLAGAFELDLRGSISPRAAHLSQGSIELSQPKLSFDNHWFSQPNLKLDFDGRWDWPSGNFRASSLTLLSDALSAQMLGTIDHNGINLDIQSQAKLDRIWRTLQNETSEHVRGGSWAQKFLAIGLKGNPTPVIADWLLEGEVLGHMIFRQHGTRLDIETDIQGESLTLKQRPSRVASPELGRTLLEQIAAGTWLSPALEAEFWPESLRPLPAQAAEARVVWAEPKIQMHGLVIYDAATRQASMDALTLSTDWFTTSLSGQAAWDELTSDVELNGPLHIEMQEVGRRLTRLTNADIRFQGAHESPLHIHLHRSINDSTSLFATGQLGWDSAEAEGIVFGPARIPVQISETHIQIAPSKVPIGDGYLNLAADVSYQPGPVVIHLPPGRVAESVELTHPITARWLNRIAPSKSQVDSLQGRFGVEIDEASINLESPEQSKVAGRLKIRDAEVLLSQAGQDMLNDTKRLILASREQELGEGVPVTPIANVLLPTQSVDFDLKYGVIKNSGTIIELGKMRIVNRGQVSLDGDLDMIATVPSGSLGLREQSADRSGKLLHIPVSGTIFDPVVDAAGFGIIATLLTSKPMRDAADLIKQQSEFTQTMLQERQDSRRN